MGMVPICGVAIMEYEGRSVEVVVRGISGGTAGNKGSTTATLVGTSVTAAGTGAGAAGLALLFFFFLAFPLPIEKAPPPAQQQHNTKRRSHCQICNCEPKEPEAVEPELAELEESLALDPVLKESSELEEPAGPEPKIANESEDGSEPEEADESKAVIVVVTVSLAALPRKGRTARTRMYLCMVAL